jgi:hypothetical protein
MLGQWPGRRRDAGRAAMATAAFGAAALIGLGAAATAGASGQVSARTGVAAQPAAPVTLTAPNALAGSAGLAGLVRPDALGGTRVLLITGQQFAIVGTPGGGLASVLLSGPGHVPIWTLHVAGSTYYFPVDAVPYLGRGLDPSLFSVGALERLEAGGRLPVRLTYAGRRPVLPGITITSARGGVASGYLTAKSARRFGAALARQFGADHATGSYGRAGLLSGLTIRLAGAPGAREQGAGEPAPAGPRYALHTLTVNATNEWGKPDNGDVVMIVNADNPATFGDPDEIFNTFYHGSARFVVPAGHYWAVTDFLAFLKADDVSQRVVVLPQFTVAGNDTRVQLTAKSATSEVTVKTPRPTLNYVDNWQAVRYGRHGAQAGTGTFTQATPLWISPVSTRPSVGSIQSFTSAELPSPGRRRVPYAYNVDFIGPRGVIPQQHFVVSPDTLSTIRERIYLNPASSGRFVNLGGTVTQLLAASNLGAVPDTAPMPDQQIEYYTADPAIAWYSGFLTFSQAMQDDAFYTLPGRANTTMDWNEYPLHPQPDGRDHDGLANYPSAFRVGNKLWFLLNPFSDNSPGHVGDLSDRAPYSVRQDGRQIGKGQLSFGMASVKVTAKPSVIRLALTASEPSTANEFSAATDTVWTMHTHPQPRAVIPGSWACFIESYTTGPFVPTQKCAVLPMLAVSYHVRGLRLDGFAPVGSQQISVDVGHIALAKAAPIVAVKVRVSWDQGQTWQPVKVSRTSAGHYRLAFTAAAGVDPTLSLTATDAAGNSIAETITDAYGVGG